MAFHRYRSPRKSFARKLARRVYRKVTGPARRASRRFWRNTNRRYYRKRSY